MQGETEILKISVANLICCIQAFGVHWATDWTIGVLGFDSWSETENFSLHHRVQNGSVAHPASYPMGSKGSFPGGKAAES
jgi:hypothetical protein